MQHSSPSDAALMSRCFFASAACVVRVSFVKVRLRLDKRGGAVKQGTAHHGPNSVRQRGWPRFIFRMPRQQRKTSQSSGVWSGTDIPHRLRACSTYLIGLQALSSGRQRSVLVRRFTSGTTKGIWVEMMAAWRPWFSKTRRREIHHLTESTYADEQRFRVCATDIAGSLHVVGWM